MVGGKKIICGVASIERRSAGFEKTIKSIINQVDKLIVYQNGYKELYDFLLHPKIDIYSSIDTGIDMGDAGKFYKIDQYNNSYYFTIDDDLIYPDDYVVNSINNLNHYDNNVIITYHGRVLNTTAKNYYRDITRLNHFNHLQKIDEFVHFGGTGVMCFDTNKFKISFNDLTIPNICDVWVGLMSRVQNIPIVCLKHGQNWIKTWETDDSESIFSTHAKSNNIQNDLIVDYDNENILIYDQHKKIVVKTKVDESLWINNQLRNQRIIINRHFSKSITRKK
jgi:hypothetical protein